MNKSIVYSYIEDNCNTSSLRRGKHLFYQKKVLEIVVSSKLITAKVMGTQLYSVTIRIDNDNIIFTECSCLYNHGGICKHTIAALLHYSVSLKEYKNPYLKLHNTSDWFLIAKNNSFSLKEIIDRFNIDTYWFNSEYDFKADVNYLQVIIKDWDINKVEFKIENKQLFTKCDCDESEKLLCDHQIRAIVSIFNINSVIFNEIRADIVKKRAKKLLLEYGLQEKEEYLKLLKPTFENGKLLILPTGKLKGVINKDSKKEKNFVSVYKNQFYGLKPFYGPVPKKQKKHDYHLGYILGKNFVSEKLSIPQFNIVVGKVSKNGEKLINPIREIDDYNVERLPLTKVDNDIISLINQLKPDDIDSFIERNDLRNMFDDTIKPELCSFLFPILSKLFEQIINKPFIYYKDSFKDRNLLKLSLSKPQISYKLIEKENFFELKLVVKIAGKNYSFQKLEKVYYSSMLIIAENTAYLINSVQDDLIISNALKYGDSIKTTKDNFKQFFDEYIKPISVKYPIELKLLSIDMETTKTTKKIKQVYIFEVDNFVLFSPIVLYDDYYKANVFETGHVLNLRGQKLISITRDNEFEQNFLAFFRTLHESFENQKMNDYFFLSYDDFLKKHWFFKAFDKLNNENIEIFGFDKLTKLKYNPNKVKVAVQIKSEIDWFDLEINVSFGNINVSIKDVRKTIINKEDYIKLSDGSLGVLPEEWIEKFKTYFRQGELKKEKIKISKLKFNFIDELFKEIDNSEIINEIEEKKRKLKKFTHIKKTKVPEALQGTLRDYQKAGFNWLNFLEEFKWGGILADDMGLGKTIQVISFLLKIHLKKRNASLVVVPTTLLFNWQNEFKKFAPSLNIYFHYGTERKKEKIDVKKNDVIITSYGIMMRDIKLIKKYKFTCAVLDESQAIKNPESMRFKAAMLLKAQNKIAMTGTPIENNTFDLYAQMEFLNPGFLGTKSVFKEQYSDPIDKDRNVKVAKELQKVVSPFIIRRTKEQVASELPDKTENYMFCEMSEGQQKVYEAFRNKYRNMLLGKIDEDGVAKSKIYVIEGLMKLRQICDSPAILSDNGDYGTESVKIVELLRHIKEKTGKHKILVFSQFVKMLSQIKYKLDDEKISYEYLDGQSSQKNRQKSVRNFQENDDVRVFLISLKAGGTGINLTSADYVYLVDPWWNPAVESQAIDRTHRIGQKKKVIAYRMICRNTIEEKIMKYQERKLKVASDIISAEENFVKQLDKDDIDDLFS